MNQSDQLVKAALDLRDSVSRLRFCTPVAFVYNPLEYAWNPHRRYLETYGDSTKRVVFLGMNPGPWGMAQTGVPFGEIQMVRGWLGIEADVGKPENEHPKRPVTGFDCERSEVSGLRLWGLFKDRFVTAENFFSEHFVANFCPLMFLEASGRNRTPDRLVRGEKKTLLEHCDIHLRRIVETLNPEWVVGIGNFAYRSLTRALDPDRVRIEKILHPSPASPSANRGWAGQVSDSLVKMGIWG